MIKLVNINLSKVDKLTQVLKTREEELEFFDALTNHTNGKDTKEHVVEEYLDFIQSLLGVLQKEGITADEVMEHYPKHLEKLKSRPRD